MPSVFLRFCHIVYTTSMSFILFPEMLLALTSWAASSMMAEGTSSNDCPWNEIGHEKLQRIRYSARWHKLTNKCQCIQLHIIYSEERCTLEVRQENLWPVSITWKQIINNYKTIIILIIKLITIITSFGKLRSIGALELRTENIYYVFLSWPDFKNKFQHLQIIKWQMSRNYNIIVTIRRVLKS